jgi:hypothetical protein
VVSGVGQVLRGNDAFEQGQHAKGSMLYGSAVAFFGLGGLGLVSTVGAVADKQVAKGIASAAMRRMVMRYGAQGTATLLGVSMSGWGLILLGGALIFEGGAMLLTPTALQEWMRRSYFGKGPADKRFEKGDWDAEIRALEIMLEGAKEDEPKPIPLSTEYIAP